MRLREELDVVKRICAEFYKATPDGLCFRCRKSEAELELNNYPASVCENCWGQMSPDEKMYLCLAQKWSAAGPS